ncbi:hypothetical protein LPUS_07753 [Lasallia pustulata]|uniref:F-box domain-containing protein n=1 Tax=Lasallia pustulata TaxID=136370 RepID=A0A1W5D3T8_9LECA|nr:hypothetical protein LPUS_07753 [Lasallia pustulata]
MPTSFDSLPFELVDAVLTEATQLHLKEIATYTYGLSQAPEPLQNVPQMLRVVRGGLPPDALRWHATTSLRQVNRTWHDWALLYAIKTTWMENLTALQSKPSGIAVYRDPYCSLRRAARLFRDYPHVATCIRRLWLDGFYGAETNKIIFDMLPKCTQLQSVTLPWTVLRHGDVGDWVRLLRQGQPGGGLKSLELLAVDLKKAQTALAVNKVNKNPLESPRVDFSGLKRLKIFGSTNLNPITDDDLKAMARTAAHLEEFHVTGTSSVTLNGVMSIVDAAKETLQTLEYSPLSSDGFDHPDSFTSSDDTHLCQSLLECPKLKNLLISLPSICPDLFNNASVHWTGDVDIRAGGFCGQDGAPMQVSHGEEQICKILDRARKLMEVREKEGVRLEVCIYISKLPRVYNSWLRSYHGVTDGEDDDTDDKIFIGRPLDLRTAPSLRSWKFRVGGAPVRAHMAVGEVSEL